MAVREISFNPGKTLEAIVLVASRLRAANLESDLHSISKLLYWADKWHLQRYGCTVSGDTYIAMKNGPVPSNVYDMLKYVRGDGKFDFPKEVRKAFEVRNQFEVHALREPNVNRLSQSEVAALAHAIETYGALNFDERTKASHDAAWKSADRNDEIPLVEIVKLLPNGDEVLAYLDSE
jgi:uncharacterized phage-associated protein